MQFIENIIKEINAVKNDQLEVIFTVPKIKAGFVGDEIPSVPIVGDTFPKKKLEAEIPTGMGATDIETIGRISKSIAMETSISAVETVSEIQGNKISSYDC